VRRPEVHDILHALESKILLFPRFRSVPFATQNGCVWRDLGEKGIDVASHIINHAPVSGGDDGMETAVNRLCTQSLDTCRPQWIVHLLPAEEIGTESLLLFRLNHAIADGRTLMTQAFGLARCNALA